MRWLLSFSTSSSSPTFICYLAHTHLEFLALHKAASPMTFQPFLDQKSNPWDPFVMGPLVLQNGDKRLILANNRVCWLGSWLQNSIRNHVRVIFVLLLLLSSSMRHTPKLFGNCFYIHQISAISGTNQLLQTQVFAHCALKCLFNFHEIKPCLCPFYGPCHLFFWPYFL